MSGITIHLRSETKPLERRSALTPAGAKALLSGIPNLTLNVERSALRIFDDEDFEKAGANLVEEGSWVNAPADHIILGLKEILEDDFPLKHVHITFHHIYKNQAGWADILSRYARGGGTLLDLEFLEKEVAPGRFVRVAAYGWSAGFSGAALAIRNWAWQLTNPGTPLPSVESYDNENDLIADVKNSLEEGKAKSGKLPRVFVMGALGRCGRGAVELCSRVGLEGDNVLKWDLAETSAKAGPYAEIVERDIFVNCIYLSSALPSPFLDLESLKSPARQLSVMCDVSADTTNPHNPVPIYTVATTFDKPTVPVEGLEGPPLSVISIDHLPSLLPREASETYGNDLVPYLMKLPDWRNDPVWSRAEALFKKKVAELPEELQKA